ncbi:MAG: hypothetical protein AABX59_03170, partial [Nanoarchaeota archaeon]
MGEDEEDEDKKGVWTMETEGSGDLETLLGKLGLKEASRVAFGEQALRAQKVISEFITDFSVINEATSKLVGEIDKKEHGIRSHLRRSRRIFDPNYDKSFGGLVDVTG